MKTFLNPLILGVVLLIGLTACASNGARHASSTAARTPPDRVTAMTGVTACDDYLAIYRTCHQEARTYAVNQLNANYQSMRDILFNESKDPHTRPLLANRCRFLSQQIVQAAHNPACGKQ